MRSSLEKFTGWLGLGLLLGAYGLASAGALIATNIVYLLMNLFGAAIMVWISWKNKVYPVLVVDTFWCLITIVGIFKAF